MVAQRDRSRGGQKPCAARLRTWRGFILNRCCVAMSLPPILFEDDVLLAFDKPSGLLVAPDRWDKTRENLMGLVHAHSRYGHSVANVHRLDADTSGILLCAKTKPALDFLTGQFQSKTVEKKYHALVAVLSAEHAMKVVAPIRDDIG